MAEARWARIPDFPDYEVSTEGEVYSHKRGKLMSLVLRGGRVPSVVLRGAHGKQGCRTVASLQRQAGLNG